MKRNSSGLRKRAAQESRGDFSQELGWVLGIL